MTCSKLARSPKSRDPPTQDVEHAPLGFIGDADFALNLLGGDAALRVSLEGTIAAERLSLHRDRIGTNESTPQRIVRAH
jgi:hypothetical protein